MNRMCLAFFAIASSASAASWQPLPLRDNGSIALWTVAGPLPNAVPQVHGNSCFGYIRDYLKDGGGENRIIPSDGDRITFDDGKSVQWKTVFSDPSGHLDYIRTFDVSTHEAGVAYAFCRLISNETRRVLLKIRSNDGVRVWLNQEMVHDHHVGRTIESAEDTVPVTLTKGDNRLLVKVGQSGGDWGLILRVVAPNNGPVPGVQSAVSTDLAVKEKVFSAAFTDSPLVLNTPEGPRQMLTAHVTSGGAREVTCRIQKAEWARPQIVRLGDLSPGEHHLDINVPVITETGPARITLRFAGGELTVPDVTLTRPREWTVYLVQHVHTDIGYTRPQTEILPEHLRYIDYALDYCDLTDDYPDDARFRWTCEISWAVREYLNRRPRAQIDRLKRRVAEGRIEIAGMFLNMSEIAGESSLAASLQPIRRLKDDFGVPVRTAMQNDVNGIGWCLADYFHGIGLKYLTMGINKTRSLLPFDKPTPFWWESPSGKRVLALRADHYHTGNFWRIHDGVLAPFESGLRGYLDSLVKRGYSFDSVSVQYSGYHTDNSPPAMKPCEMIRAWNEKYAWPRLRSATAQEFMRHVEKTYGDKLEVYRSAWPDWWTDGFGSAARETAASRQTHAAMQVNDTLLAMASLLGTRLSPSVMDRAAAVEENLLFYDEHTFGASQSISDPMSESSMVQWGQKASYAWEAVKQAALLREEALGALQSFLPRASVSTVAVFNTLNWKRSGAVEVFIDHEILPENSGFRIVDPDSGNSIPAQRLGSRREGTFWALWAGDVPPLGYKSYRIELGDHQPAAPGEASAEAGTLENDFYRLTVDPQTAGLTSLIDKPTGRQLVDQEADWHCGQLLYETLPGTRDLQPDAFRRVSLRNVKLKPGSRGPIWRSVRFQAEMDGCATTNGVRGEIRLYDTAKRVEFHFAIRKLPVTGPEAVYVAFPFDGPGAKIVYEGQGGLVHPGENQLPGSASDWQTVQSYLAVRGQDGQIIWGSDQAPLVQLGDFNLGKWQPVTKVDRPHVYSWVMNNYWFTNFRATQEGEFRWSYYLTSGESADNASATRFGWGSRIALISRVLPPGGEPDAAFTRSALEPDGAGVVLVSARPARYNDGVILHLRELNGQSAVLNLPGKPGGVTIESAVEVNVLEEPLRPVGPSVAFDPYEAKFVNLMLSR